jgi:GNAT superfamily N-acetyltransferase
MQKFRLVRCEGDDAEELHKLAFAADYWPGDGHTYWIARDAAGAVAGFCSAVYWVDIRCVFLSRAAVTTEARGCGLQRLMIAQRILWAQEEGAKAVYTYTEQHNYPSVINLIKAGLLKALERHPDALQAVADYNDQMAAEADAQGYEQCVEFHEKRARELEAEAKRVRSEWEGVSTSDAEVGGHSQPNTCVEGK